MILNFDHKLNHMKTLYLIRHAKSSWEDSSLRDIQRPLNPRGKRDAPFMAKLLKGKGIQADAIVSSPANRAFTTSTYFAKEMGIEENEIIQEDSIYEAYTEDIFNVIHSLHNSINTVFLFGHNPTFTSMANMFTQNYIANVPTCGIVVIESAAESWSAFGRENSLLKDYYYPKQYF